MQRDRSLGTLIAVLIVVVTLALAPVAWAQDKFTTLYDFTAARGEKDGLEPLASVVFDPAGNLYGTTAREGPYSSGTVFRLTRNSEGKWQHQVLYTFAADGGKGPVSSLVLDQGGNLYGTTYYDGAAGSGTVFELMPGAHDSWTERELYSFCSLTNCADGSAPIGSVIFDAAGNLYGTTQKGGTGCPNEGCGVVFKLAPSAGGAWAESVLYSFCSRKYCGDGAWPEAMLVFDTAGNLYGTTLYGGDPSHCQAGGGCGVVFKLTQKAKSGWKNTVLHRFRGRDGANPFAGLTFDHAGNLYGTTGFGGNLNYCLEFGGCGVVFKLAPNSNGRWTETVLHRFVGPNGSYSFNDLTFDQAGNLYGTTSWGGNSGDCPPIYGGCGVVFKLAPNAKGGWDETVLHRFVDHPGANPRAGVIFDGAGNLYGTTAGDDTGTFGSVFMLTP